MTSKSRVWSFIVILMSGAILLSPLTAWPQTPIDCGQTLAGTISAPAEKDSYTFTASADDGIIIRVRKTTYEDGSKVNYAYDAAGNRITLTNE